MGRLRFKPTSDLRCGKHSGIPLCCIFWFIFFWCPLWRFERLRMWYFYKSYEWEYIPCVACLISKRDVGELKKCKCGEGIPEYKQGKDGVWREKK
ncbi:MAG: hypothetical protein H8E55_14170 [Pelagibacterales bacterium]|nr:hypothetical protein [Pelagibacterales bacterium]